MVLSSLGQSPLTLDEIKNYEKSKTETKNVKLQDPIPVELRYETIVVEDGKLKIFRDVYEKGTNTEENLRRVLQVYGVSLDSINQADRDKILAGLNQMARDAQGNPVEANEKDTNKKSTSDHITRNPKGKTEVEFVLPELKGKGYPAPVGMK
jgi:hypothetical protein